MTARKQPITRRFAGQWIFRGKVWTPDLGSIAQEGPVDESIGRLLMALMALNFGREKYLTPKVKALIEKTNKQIAAETGIGVERKP